jgi:hypothetical protein
MSLPEYVGRRNSTTLVGSPPFGYACTDDRAGDACAFWHPPGVKSREMEYHETPYAKMAPRKRRTSSFVPKSRHYSSESLHAARPFFLSHKRSFPFVGHFSGTPDAGLLSKDFCRTTAQIETRLPSWRPGRIPQRVGLLHAFLVIQS